jgi:1,4-alpha-glucan branching enzyme
VEEEVTSAAAVASTSIDAEDKPEPSKVVKGSEKTGTGGLSEGAKQRVVEEKLRVISPPGDGQQIYQIDPMLEGFRNHIDYR